MKHEKLILTGIIGLGVYLYFKHTQAVNALSDEMTTVDETLQPIGEKIMSIVTGSTRGERNNNPGNIRKGPAWQGLAEDQSRDSAFAVFSAPEYGIRALGKLLQNYQSQGLNTVRSIINKYAPSSENDTGAYVNAVASQVGVGANDAVDLHDTATLTSMVNAIIKHENGRNIYADNGITEAGVAMLA